MARRLRIGCRPARRTRAGKPWPVQPMAPNWRPRLTTQRFTPPPIQEPTGRPPARPAPTGIRWPLRRMEANCWRVVSACSAPRPTREQPGRLTIRLRDRLSSPARGREPGWRRRMPAVISTPQPIQEPPGGPTWVSGPGTLYIPWPLRPTGSNWWREPTGSTPRPMQEPPGRPGALPISGLVDQLALLMGVVLARRERSGVGERVERDLVRIGVRRGPH